MKISGPESAGWSSGDLALGLRIVIVLVDPISARVLGAVYSTLKQFIKPALTSDESRIQLDLAMRAIDLARSRQGTLVDDLTELMRGEWHQLREISEFLRQQGEVSIAAAIDTLLGTPIDETPSVTSLEEQRTRLERTICGVIAPLLGLAASSDAHVAARAAQLIKDVVRIQRQFTAKQDPESVQGAQSVFAGGRIDDAVSGAKRSLDFSDEALTTYLRTKFPSKTNVRAIGTRIIAGGYSKRTVFFTMLSDAEPVLRAVVRMDIPGPMDRSVTDEFPLLKLLFAAGLPVAEPHWLESDANWFGGRFMVSEQCPGKAEPMELLADPAKGEVFGRQLAAMMAKLHALDLSSIDAEAAKKSAAEYARRDITRYYDYYRERKKVPQPLLELSFTWLLSNIPKQLEQTAPSLTHADLGFHNILIDDGKLGAVLDWETSHIGDHAEDLYYTKAFVIQIMSWDKFLQYYYDFGGKHCPAESEAFYGVWRGARIAGNIAKIRSAYEDEMPEAIAYAVLSYVFGRRFELESAAALTALFAP